MYNICSDLYGVDTVKGFNDLYKDKNLEELISEMNNFNLPNRLKEILYRLIEEIKNNRVIEDSAGDNWKIEVSVTGELSATKI